MSFFKSLLTVYFKAFKTVYFSAINTIALINTWLNDFTQKNVLRRFHISIVVCKHTESALHKRVLDIYCPKSATFLPGDRTSIPRSPLCAHGPLKASTKYVQN